MRRACIDIGSNTTRLLVADCDGRRLVERYQERSFTRIGRGLLLDGTISPEKVSEVTAVVAAQLARARELDVGEVRAVATAAIRRAPNRQILIAAIREACGLEVEILSGADEARLAFVGAAWTLNRPCPGALGVVDVGGGSSELVVGTAPDEVSWWRSLAIGSGDLADAYLHSDPPRAEEIAQARAVVERQLVGLEAPRPVEALAVGGSATSLLLLAGPRLDATAFMAALSLLGSEPAAEIAGRYSLDAERVRLLPAGLLILEAASKLLGAALSIARGGIREAVLLESGQ